MKKQKLMALVVGLAVALASGSALADGDAKKGAAFFKKKCKLCHTVKKDDKHKVGPNLFGVAGRQAGATDFKKYEAQKGSEVVWDDAALDAWLTDPKKWAAENGKEIKKTKMTAKTKKAKDRADVIAYLHTLK